MDPPTDGLIGGALLHVVAFGYGADPSITALPQMVENGEGQMTGRKQYADDKCLERHKLRADGVELRKSDFLEVLIAARGDESAPLFVVSAQHYVTALAEAVLIAERLGRSPWIRCHPDGAMKATLVPIGVSDFEIELPVTFDPKRSCLIDSIPFTGTQNPERDAGSIDHRSAVILEALIKVTSFEKAPLIIIGSSSDQRIAWLAARAHQHVSLSLHESRHTIVLFQMMKDLEETGQSRRDDQKFEGFESVDRISCSEGARTPLLEQWRTYGGPVSGPDAAEAMAKLIRLAGHYRLPDIIPRLAAADSTTSPKVGMAYFPELTRIRSEGRIGDGNTLMEDIRDALSVDGRVSIIAHGVPGSAKTATARWLAEQLGIDAQIVTSFQVAERWYGQSERNLADAFRRAGERNALLVLDEADTLFADRGCDQRRHEVSEALTTTLAMLLDQMKVSVFLITNYPNRIDQAIRRRMSMSIEFLPLDAALALKGWREIIGDPYPEVELGEIGDGLVVNDLVKARHRYEALKARAFRNRTPIDRIEAAKRLREIIDNERSDRAGSWAAHTRPAIGFLAPL